VLLVLVSEDGSGPVEVALSTIHALSATATADGTPSITLNVSSPNGKRGTMIVSFIGGGGIPSHDERGRIRQAIGDAVAALRAGASVPGAGSAPEPATRQDRTSPRGRTLLAADHILVKKKEYTAELTGDLLILTPEDMPDASPLTVSRDVIAGGAVESTPAGDPVLRLKVRTADGSERMMALTFSEWYGGGRGPECDRWFAVLKGGAAAAAAPEPPRSDLPRARGPSAPAQEPTGTGRGRSGGGSPVPGPSFCTECGEVLPGEGKFCPHCGAPLDVRGEGITESRAEEGRSETHRYSPSPGGTKRHKRGPRRKLAFRFRSQEGKAISRVRVMEKVFGFLLAPEEAFSHTSSEDVRNGVVHLALMMVLFAAVQGSALFLIGGSVDAASYPVMAGIAADTTSLLLTMAELALAGIVFIVLEALLVFLVLRLTGYADGPGETVRTCCYAATPFGTIGLLPIFGPVLAILWTLFLQFRGIRTVHETPAGITAAAVILPVIIVAGLFWLLLLGGGAASAGGIA